MSISSAESSSISMTEFKRLILIGIQIHNIFNQLTNEDEETIKKYVGLVEKKQIESFTFYAMKAGKSYAELTVKIDWDEYECQMSAGKTIVKTKYSNGVLSPTKNIVNRFSDYVETNGFLIEWNFRYASNVDIEKARLENGTSQAQPKERAKDASDLMTQDYSIKELPEMTYKLGI